MNAPEQGHTVAGSAVGLILTGYFETFSVATWGSEGLCVSRSVSSFAVPNCCELWPLGLQDELFLHPLPLLIGWLDISMYVVVYVDS